MNKKQLIVSLVLLVCAVSALIVCLNQVKNNDVNTTTTTTAPVITPDGKELTLYKYTDDKEYFDTYATIMGYAETKEEFDSIVAQVLTELEEYHKLYDIYSMYSGMNNIRTINKLYDGEHKVVTVDKKLIDMLLYAKELYVKTNGKMNIAMGSVLSIWHDYREAADENFGVGEIPSMDILQEAALHTDINNLIIDEENCTVYISDPKMKLDVGAIAKGYAVEMIAQMLEKQGITSYVLNVGGNIRTIGKKADGKTWATGIENPLGGEPVYISYLGLSGEAIVTSGSYRRNFIGLDGKEYHHIIDGETLMPATYFVGVSVICKSSADGDGLSTALFCMSLEEGQALVESLEGVEVMWTLPDGTQIRSSGFSHYEDQYKK